jgi:hypothetical protein
MKCGICKDEIIREKRREHLRFHKLDDTLVEWLIETDDDLISLYEKHWSLFRISNLGSIFEYHNCKQKN